MRDRSGPRGRLWVPLLLFAAYLLMNAGGRWYYQSTRESLARTVGGRLKQAASLVAARIDPEQVVLSAEPLGDVEAIIYVDTVLQSARSSGDFASLTLLSPDGTEWLGEADDSAATAVHRRQVIAAAAGAAFDAATAGVPEVSRLYRSRGSYFLAACVPLLDYDSTVLAVVAAEAGNDYFDALDGLRQGLLLLDGFAGLLLLAIGAIWAGVQKRLARAEDAALRSAQLAAMGQMVATVAHELKNPLGIIKNSAERLRKKYGASASDPLFDFIPGEVDRLDSLLRRYLQFAKLEVGEIEKLELTEFSMHLQDQLGLSDDATARVFIRVPEGLAVAADPAALRQVLLNLLLNAVEACRRSGGGEVRLSAAPRGDAVEIVVADTGVGMDPDTLRRAAEPFFTTRADGSGLGIYLARTLTEKMQGTMRIRSREGEGTTVSLILPAAGV